MNLQDVRGCVEFGIITIRADEYTAVLERLPARLTIHGGKHLYEFCRVPTARGGESGTAVVRCLEPGQGFAQSVTRDLIDDLNPKWLLLVGIAGGIPSDDFTLGDVLLASRVHDFSVSAANQDGVPQWNVGGGPVHTHVARLLSHLPACTEKIAGWNLEQSISRRKPTVTVSDQMSAQQLRGPDEWKEKILACLRRHYLPDLPPRPPLFWVGQAASSNTLVKDPGLLLQWLQLARAVTHVEMELAAVQAAARTINWEYPVLSIRALSDIVGLARDPAWTEFACQAAAAFCFALIKSRVIGEAMEWDWQDDRVIGDKLNTMSDWFASASSTSTTSSVNRGISIGKEKSDSIEPETAPAQGVAAPARLEPTKQPPGILIIGPGGTGKTTFAKLLTGHYSRTPFDVPGPYEESYQAEGYALKGEPGAEIVVPPGQEFRREANWDALLRDLENGRFRGIVLNVAYGYHSLGQMRYKDHALFKRTQNKSLFREAYLKARRIEEKAVLLRLMPHIMKCHERLWLLTLVGKEDLWWNKRAEVERHYRQGDFGKRARSIQQTHGNNRFRYELVLASLVISNFISSVGETLARNCAGYDHGKQVASLRRLVEMFDSLRKWEEET